MVYFIYFSVYYICSGERMKYIKNYRDVAVSLLGNKCNRCGSTANLQIHHKKYANTITKADVELLCSFCHAKERKQSETFKTMKFQAIVSRMGRKKIVNVPAKNPIKAGDQVQVNKIKKEEKKRKAGV